MANEEKPMCIASGTKQSVNHIHTECLQYTDELKNLNILNTLDTALGLHQLSFNIYKKYKSYN